MTKIYPLIGNAKSAVVSNLKTVKYDIKDTAVFFRDNAKAGWRTGRIYSKSHNICKFNAFWIKLFGTLKNTKLRAKDVPSVLGGVGTIAPVPGGSLVGYGLGKGITKLLKVIKR